MPSVQLAGGVILARNVKGLPRLFPGHHVVGLAVELVHRRDRPGLIHATAHRVELRHQLPPILQTLDREIILQAQVANPEPGAVLRARVQHGDR